MARIAIFITIIDPDELIDLEAYEHQLVDLDPTFDSVADAEEELGMPLALFNQGNFSS